MENVEEVDGEVAMEDIMAKEEEVVARVEEEKSGVGENVQVGFRVVVALVQVGEGGFGDEDGKRSMVVSEALGKVVVLFRCSR